METILERSIRELGASSQNKDALAHILADTSRHFNMACGFIYETSPERELLLREKFQLYDHEMPLSIPLIELMALLPENNGMPHVIYSHTGILEKPQPLLEVFAAKTLVLMPIYADADGDLIGLTGLADRRYARNIAPSQIHTAETLLILLSTHVKLRINELRLEQSWQAMTSTMDNMGIDLYVNDFETHEMMYANESMAAPYGGWESMKDKYCYAALYEGQTEECGYCPKSRLIDHEGNPTKIYSWDYQRPFDGRWFRVLSRAFRWTDGRLAHVISSVDITENKNNEALVTKMALYDVLTGLPNRRKLEMDMAQMIEGKCGRNEPGYIIFFDLDGFKSVNDTYGHDAGDNLLRAISHYMLAKADEFGITYRNAGDEFVVLLPVLTLEEAVQIAKRIVQRFNISWELPEDVQLISGVSIGIAKYPDDGQIAEDLLRSADMAMYQAKQQGKGAYRIYEKDIKR